MVFNIFGNSTHETIWVPNPTARGTWDILQTCLLTTSLCVWTAIHLNIKEHDNPTFLRIPYQTWRKVGWLLVGLMAPEMLVYTAWYQRTKANKFMNAYNERFGLTPPQGWFRKAFRKLFCRPTKKQEESPNEMGGRITLAARTPKKRPWGLAQGFYAQMGGFALDTAGTYPQLVLEGKKTLNYFWFQHFLHLEDMIIDDPRQLEYEFSSTQKEDEESGSTDIDFIENESDRRGEQDKWNQSTKQSTQAKEANADLHGLFEFLNKSERDISDKSKSSGLAKSIVCLQALWFCLQCLARLGEALPITLLELNTFAHATCALLVYILWWDKPLDVEKPTYIPIKGTKALYMWARSNIDSSVDEIGRSEKLSSWISRGFGWKPPKYKKVGYEELNSAYLQLTNEHSGLIPRDLSIFIYDAIRTNKKSCPGILIPSKKTGGLIHDSYWPDMWWPIPNHDFSGVVPCFEQACLRVSHTPWRFSCSFEYTKEYSTRLKNWPGFDFSRPWIQLLFVLVAFLYGGLHSLAWSTTFPSNAQRNLWRISSVSVMGGGLIALISYYLFSDTEHKVRPLNETLRTARWRLYIYLLTKPLFKHRLIHLVDNLPNRKHEYIEYMIISPIYLIPPLYFFARVYLVVESYIQLFHLQPGPIFEQPTWAAYIPHLS